MVITFALAGMVLALGRAMRVELIASANQVAAAQADAVERAGEQYVLGVLTTEGQNVSDVAEEQFANVQVGDGFFWILRPDFDDASLPDFGPVAESVKVNINRASYPQLMMLPGMTDEIAGGIVDWRDADSDPSGGGGNTEADAKNADFETVEETLMIQGMTRTVLYGDGTAPPLGQRTSQIGFGGGGSSSSGASFVTDPQIARGLYDVLTIYTAEPNTTTDGQQRVNLANWDPRRTPDQIRQRLTARLNDSAKVNTIMSRLGNQPVRNLFDMAMKARMDEADVDLISDDFLTGNRRGRINLNTAPRSVLLCVPGMNPASADRLLAGRAGANPAPGTLGWAATALQNTGSDLSGFTSRTYQWSADILAVSGNGRMFKRCRIVVDMQSGTPTIVYRRDITDRGWPMDKQILASIRAGQGTGNYLTGVGNGTGTMGGGGSLGGSGGLGGSGQRTSGGMR